MEKLNDNKIFKVIITTLRVICIVFLICFMLVVCLQRFSNNKLSFFNYRMFTVVSGSMKPKYDVGDILISKDVDPSKIKIGDSISYLGTTDNFVGKVITHQVVNIKKDQNGKYVFYTKGLANLVMDPAVEEDRVYGVVIYKSNILSFVYKIVSNKVGFYFCIIVPLLYIVASEIIGILLEKEEKRRLKK